jgi:DNA-binding HxlR family transcriptional regulator
MRELDARPRQYVTTKILSRWSGVPATALTEILYRLYDQGIVERVEVHNQPVKGSMPTTAWRSSVRV